MLVNQKHFIIIGAQRSGSTMLYGILDQHPEIYMAKPVRPEPKYFLQGDGTYDDYKKSLFSDQQESTWLGEKSTSYYETPQVAQRIKTCIPRARIIFLMRNPVDRAISNYWFSKQNGFESRSLEEVFLQNVGAPQNNPQHVSVDPFDYLGRGEYLRHLNPYLELFGPENFLPLVFEQVVNDNELLNLWGFLDLKPIDFKRQQEHKNSSEVRSESVEVRNALNEYFLPLNHELSQSLNIDLGVWNN